MNAWFRWAPPSCYPGISSCSVTITRIYVWEIGIRSNNIDTYWQRGNRYRKTQICRRKSNNGNLPITDSVKISEENLQALLWLVRYWAWFASLLERVTHRLLGINFFIVCNSPPRLPWIFLGWLEFSWNASLAYARWQVLIFVIHDKALCMMFMSSIPNQTVQNYFVDVVQQNELECTGSRIKRLIGF